MANAEQIIDQICEKGGRHFYNNYIARKLRPYTILQKTQEFTVTANLGNIQGEPQEYTHDGTAKGLLQFPKKDWEHDQEAEPVKSDLHGCNNLKILKPKTISTITTFSSDNI